MTTKERLQKMLSNYYQQGLPTDETELFLLVCGLEHAENVLEVVSRANVCQYGTLRKRAKLLFKIDRCIYLVQQYVCELKQYSFGQKGRCYRRWLDSMQRRWNWNDAQLSNTICQKAADMIDYFD